MNDDKRIERIETKIDDIGDTLGEVNVTLGKQHESLKAHMRRTAILEQTIIPLQKRANMIEGVILAITLAAAIAEIIHLFV